MGNRMMGPGQTQRATRGKTDPQLGVRGPDPRHLGYLETAHVWARSEWLKNGKALGVDVAKVVDAAAQTQLGRA